MRPEVSIIIPIFNQYSFTQACLEALRKDPGVSEFSEIIIVDNGSTDGSAALIRREQQKWPNLRLVSFSSNRGFSEACNAGASQALGAELVFLNNDTEPQSGWLAALRNTLKLSEVGLVGPKLLYPGTGNINHGGYVYNLEKGGFYAIYHNFPGDFAGVNKRREFQALLGACYLIRKELFFSLGGFSLYGLEDIDLCFKVRQLGKKVVYEPRSVVLHHGSVTLRNSPAGSIPPTDIFAFNDRYPADKLITDDYVFYSEDGIRINNVENEVISFEEIVTPSDALVRESRELQRQNSLVQARQKLEEAISLYLGNFEAYNELLALLLEMGCPGDALDAAERMCRHVAEQNQARLILAQLYQVTQQISQAASVYRSIVEDWCADLKIREKAEQALRDLQHPFN